MQSKAANVKDYLASLPEDRRAAIQAVREVIRKNLDKTYEEGMTYGMIGYYIPHSVFPSGYHCDPKQPLPFANLASQKNHMALYLMCVYGDSPVREWFIDAWKKAGKKLDMGKACLRFTKLEDLDLDIIGQAIKKIPAKRWMEIYTKTLADQGKGLDGKPFKAGAKAAATKKPKSTAKSPAKKKTVKKTGTTRAGAR